MTVDVPTVERLGWTELLTSLASRIQSRCPLGLCCQCVILSNETQKGYGMKGFEGEPGKFSNEGEGKDKDKPSSRSRSGFLCFLIHCLQHEL